ncbi:hypothetical protein CDL12_11264 [Handroanthus impetiginosus]|uniref:TF-B3 domain-containing protein n=1 Tax=Handroanthus impetiginosus TaxID=429701 RepID=A0A2G9HEW8_9LAMI|nr:hypothetical protein CDL12_11264 [Handroanthus impetiginosus]
MVGNCVECRKCEENMYWSRFRTVQFCQFLSGRFREHLAIPKKFTNSLREKMLQTVSLRGPSGHVWNVGLVKNGDVLFLKLGWNAFVEDHGLQENDILIFKYSGDSRFDVSIFDQGSLCEKEACYFVKKCEHAVIGQGSKRRRSMQESSEDTTESSDGAADCQLIEKIQSGSARKDTSGAKLTQSTPRRRRKTKKGRRGSGESNVFQLKSRRRKVTEEEIKRAAEMANAAAAASADCFTVVMRPSHVYKGFFMSIPAEWAKANLPSRDESIVLRVKDQEWLAKYHYKGYGGGLTGGWRNFVMDNFLEAFDVCLFEHSKGTDNAFILDVKIFRVIQEVIPPCRTRGGGDTSREDTPRGALKQLGKSVRDSTDEEIDDDEDDDDDEEAEENV